MGVADKRKLGQLTDAALRRGVRSCFAHIAQEANDSKKTCLDAVADASRPTILGEHRKDLVKSIGRTQTVTNGGREIPR